jgi:hypothetical protein
MARDNDNYTDPKFKNARTGAVEVPSDPNSGARPLKAPQSPSDIVDVYRPDSEKHIANVLARSLRQNGPATYSKKGVR